MSSRSTAEGWCFVSIGTAGIISVLRANLIVTFLLHGKERAISSSINKFGVCVCVYLYICVCVCV